LGQTLIQFLVADAVGSPEGEQEDAVLHELGEVEGPLNAAVE